jgi:Mg/Co/Ni transporter MgtE
MTSDVKYCFDDQDVAEVSSNMADIQLRRLPVVNRDNRLVGILSLWDIVTIHAGAGTEALKGISRPCEQHTQPGWLMQRQMTQTRQAN